MGILDNLNEIQLQAVKTTKGPVLIAAGPGSGKTRVVTSRIAYMIHNHICLPSEIIAITFTKKAANEMKERVGKLCGKEVGKNIWVSTFHATGVKLLRANIGRLRKYGYNANFTIADEREQLNAIKTVMIKTNVNYEIYDPRTVLQDISHAKEFLITASDYSNVMDLEEGINSVVDKVYEGYEKYLRSNNIVDFSDLLMLPIFLFRDNPDILEIYQDKFKYIMVDEYQDTNTAQYTLIRMLAEKYRNLCVVGDPDQCIYSWRNADMNNIINFKNDYKEAKEYKLEQNYRSTSHIVNAANDIIRRNAVRIEKSIWTSNEMGSRIAMHTAMDEHYEASFVSEQIKALVGSGYKYKDIVILYRTKSQSRAFEERFLREKLPYEIIGGHNFYDRKEIKDIIAYLNVIVNPHDGLSITRIINTPARGISGKTLAKLIEYASINDINLYDALEMADAIDVSHKAKNSLKAFHAMIESFRTMSQNLTLRKLLERILEDSGYMDSLRNSIQALATERLENIGEILSAISEYEEKDEDKSINGFLDYISLLTTQDEMDDKEKSGNKVTLMTVHAAKGLEFSAVFVVGVERDIFPHIRSATPDGIAEERRLFFVAVTRAKEKLYVSCARRRKVFGVEKITGASQFINEIPKQHSRTY